MGCYHKNILIGFVIITFGCYCIKLAKRTKCKEVHENIDKYPYIVRLELQQLSDSSNAIDKHNHVCIATALSSTWALTAAHCLIGVHELSVGLPYNMEKLVINYGSTDALSVNDTHMYSDVLFKVIHPAYRRFIQNNNHNAVEQNDIALLRTNPMNLTNYINLSVAGAYLLGYEAMLAGFRIANKTYESVDQSNTSADYFDSDRLLHIINVSITECHVKHHWTPTFCLSSECSKEVSVCGGDSGAPIVHSTGLVAILSVGESTGACLDSVEESRLDMAEVVVPISPYYTWISSFITE